MICAAPIAWVIDVSPNRTYPDAWILTVLCPLCGGRHIHGTGSFDELGDRVAHCHPDRADHLGSYELRMPTDDDHIAELLKESKPRCRSLTKAGHPCRMQVRDGLGLPLCGYHMINPNVPETIYYQ